MYHRHHSVLLVAAACLLALVAVSPAANGADKPKDSRPNIVWIVVEDMSPHFSCYGETSIKTPHVDKLAAQGVKFTQAFVTAPVCSAARSALITGMYQTAIGAHHHRSGRGDRKITLPHAVVPVPWLFWQAGYFVCNGGVNPRAKRLGKTDYNFEAPKLSDGPDWSGRKEGQPFFAQIQLRGGKLRHGRNWAKTATTELGTLTKSQDVKLPPYYPRDPVIVEDWARYLDAVRYTDMETGRILRRLEEEGLADNTFVFFITDHGISHARGKQFLYEEGIRIPFIVRGPGIKPASVRDDLVEHIDLAATSLALAGLEVPEWMQAKHVLGKNYQPRRFIVSARDRCDETVDHIRCVRTARYKYIRNFLPQRPYLQPNAYKDHKPILQAMRRLHASGKLNRDQALIMAQTRPTEELYDLKNDPFELNNLAGRQKYGQTLASLRKSLEDWMKSTDDKGRQGEPAEMFDSDMAVYLKQIRPRDAKRAKEIEGNIALMKRWAAEGK